LTYEKTNDESTNSNQDEGVLHLKVVRGIIFYREGFIANDTYVKLEFSRYKLKSIVAKDSGDNPSWDYTFEVEVNSMNSSDILTLSLLENRLIRDDLIGSVTQPAKTLKE